MSPMNNRVVDLNNIPQQWFLASLTHDHTPIVYVGQSHEPRAWICKLQYAPNGGRMTEGVGGSPQLAVDNAIHNVMARWFNRDA